MNTPKPSIGEARAILNAAPAVVATAAPKSQTVMGSWLPPRKAVAGGIGGILAWIILSVLQHFGIDPQPAVDAIFAIIGQTAPDAQAALAGLIALAIVTYTPPSAAEIVQHLNDEIVHIAQRDPESNVSYVLPPVAPPPGEAATIPPAKGG